MVAQHLRLVGEVIGVDTDTVAADQARLELQEIPLGARRLKDGLCIDTHLVEDDGELVHEGDVDVPLGVLDDLGGLRNLDGLCAMNTGSDHKLVNLCHDVQCLLVHTGDDLGDGLKTVHLVARVDALRRVADLEIFAADKSGFLLENRNADILGHTRIDGGLKDYDGPFCEVPPEDTARSFNRSEVRRVIIVDRCRYRHDVEFCLAKTCLVSRKVDR